MLRMQQGETSAWRSDTSLWGRERSICWAAAAKARTRPPLFFFFFFPSPAVQSGPGRKSAAIKTISMCCCCHMMACCGRHLRSAGFPTSFLYQLWHHRVFPPHIVSDGGLISDNSSCSPLTHHIYWIELHQLQWQISRFKYHLFVILSGYSYYS